MSLTLVNVTFLAPMGTLASVASFWSSDAVLASVTDLGSADSSSVSLFGRVPQRISSYSSPGIQITNLTLLPTDVDPEAAQCYQGGVAVYDSASLWSAMNNTATTTVFVFQSFPLLPSRFGFQHQINISTGRSLEVYGCAGTALNVNANTTRWAVLVGGGGSLVLRNLTLANETVLNQLMWPFRLPPLLSLVYVNVLGSCSLISVNITSQDQVDLTGYLTSFSSTNAVPEAARPIYSASDSAHAFIESWTLPGNAVWPSSPGISAADAAASVWHMRRVQVTVQPFTGCLSSGGIPGVQARTGAQLRLQLEDPLVQAIEITGDIQLVPSEWPPEALGPDQGQLFVNSTKEVFACPPAPGKRYTIDFGNLGQVIFVFGTLRFRGALLLTNPKASSRRAWLYHLIGALSVETDGVISFEGVSITSHVPHPFMNADDSFWDISCVLPNRNICPAFIPNYNNSVDYLNVSYYDAFLYNYTFNKTLWVAASQGRNITGAGYWGYTDVGLTWRPEIVTPIPSPPPSESGVPVAAIAVPVAVGGALLIAAIIALIVWRRRRSANAAAAKAAAAVPYSTASTSSANATSTKEDVLPQGSSQANPAMAASTTFSQGMSMLSASAPTEARIEDMKRVITSQAAMAGMHRNEQITLTELLGEGTFGKVYRGTWRGTTVAVKTMIMPTNMSGKEKREKMAVMETAISSSLSHPNIVQTYTYAVLPVKGDGANIDAKLSAGASVTVESTSPLASITSADSTNVHSWEVRLVLEFCDRGSLRDVLNESLVALLKAKGLSAALAADDAGGDGGDGGALRQAAALEDGGQGALQLPLPPPLPPPPPGVAAADEQCPLGYMSVLDVSLDVAKAMLHMHSENIVHGDLKARNILLKSGGPDGRGFVAKVADFGLSLRIDPHETHVSNVYQGTITHMAPEVLLHGKVSKMSDVYAFAILMWETYTAGQAFKGTPRALLGHEVTKMNRRPQFPINTPFEFQLLACRCWESDPSIRPDFEKIVEELSRMRAKLAPGTSPGGAVGGPSGGAFLASISNPRPSGSQTSSFSTNGDQTATAAAGGGHAAGLGGGVGGAYAAVPSLRPGLMDASVTLEVDTGSSIALSPELYLVQSIDGSSMAVPTDMQSMGAGNVGVGPRFPGGQPGQAGPARPPAMPPILEGPQGH